MPLYVAPRNRHATLLLPPKHHETKTRQSFHFLQRKDAPRLRWRQQPPLVLAQPSRAKTRNAQPPKILPPKRTARLCWRPLPREKRVRLLRYATKRRKPHYFRPTKPASLGAIVRLYCRHLKMRRSNTLRRFCPNRLSVSACRASTLSPTQAPETVSSSRYSKLLTFQYARYAKELRLARTKLLWNNSTRERLLKRTAPQMRVAFSNARTLMNYKAT